LREKDSVVNLLFLFDPATFNWSNHDAVVENALGLLAAIGKLLAGFFGWSCRTYLLASARKPS
jgi:hypothetical protein